jgi:secreted PhoX family phosphatase
VECVDGLLPGDDRRHDCHASGGEGQVFEFNPFNQTIKLIYNSPTALDCENPDNLTVTPRGGLLMCEDNSGCTPNDADA